MTETVGRYTLVRPLASGGMGDVFLARVTGAAGFLRPAVIKRVRPELRDRDDAVGMFLDEARLSAQLNHPHIVQVFDLGETDDGFYMAMEFVDGTHLGRLLRVGLMQHRPLSVELSAFICARVAEALHYAHHARNLSSGEPLQVVHRDVSPSNILISRGGDVKLTDFGVAKAKTQQVKTAMGYVKGKVAYLSPEQVELKKIDGRSDVFSLGIVLWELLARMRLYKEPDEFVAMDRIVKEPCPRPSLYNADIPAEVEAIVLRALEKAPGDRYANAGAFQDALDGWLRDSGVFHGRLLLADALADLAQGLDLPVTSERTEVVRGRDAIATLLHSDHEQEEDNFSDDADTIDADSVDLDDLDAGGAAAAPQSRSPTTALERRPLAGSSRSESLSETSQSGTRRPRLPSYDTPFVGRRAELDAMNRTLTEGGRVLMLSGPEGIGKTRLGVELCRRIHDPGVEVNKALADLDVSFCSLAGAADVDALSDGIARGLGLSLEVGKNAADAFIQIGAALNERGPALVLLDGVDASGGALLDAVATLRQAAPDARFLLTGREALEAQDVTLFELRPMRQVPVAAEGHEEPAAQSPAGFDAVDLFVQRMRTLQPSYVLTDDDAATVARIVARLGGNPLAIEIAAGQVARTDVAGLLDRMDDGRDAGWGESSVSVALDLGLKTLSGTEQEALLQSAIFPARMSVDAARAVLHLPSGEPVDAVLDRLLQRSLLRRERVTIGGLRDEGYRLADGIRTRAAEQLRSWPRRELLEQRFDDYFLERGAELAASVEGPLGAQARSSLAAQLPNFIAVAERSLRHRAGQTSADQAIRAALILDAHYVTVGPTTQHLAYLDRAAEQLSSFAATDGALAVKLLIARGQARFFRGWANEARVDLEDAIGRAQHLGKAGLEACALYHLAAPLRSLSPSGETRPMLQRALMLAQAAKEPGLEGRILGALGAIALDQGQAEAAGQRLEEAIALLEDTGDRRAQAIATGDLAQARYLAGRTDDSLALTGRALELFQKMGDRRSEAEVTSFLADCYADRGDLALAAEIYDRSLRLARAVGDQRREALVTAALGAVKAQRGDLDAARFDLDTAETQLYASGLGALLEVVEVGRGLLELAEARRTRGADADALIAKATARLEGASGAAARAGRRRLERALTDLLN